MALHGRNHLSQPIRVGMNGLSVLELEGRTEVAVQASLRTADGRIWQATIPPTGYTPTTIRLRLSQPLDARGEIITLTLAAPEATAAKPAYFYATSGDSLGGSLLLNEYRRPANLFVQTYGRGHPLQALAEQLLPAPFRLRLQQYKAIKGNAVAWLATAVVGLSGAFWVLAAGGQGGRGAGEQGSGGAEEQRSRGAENLLLTTHFSLFTSHFLLLTSSLLLLFLAWQLGSGRLLLWPQGVDWVAGGDGLSVAAVPLPDEWWVVDDFNLTLWTAERHPEARFITQTDLGAIGVPADSAVRWPLVVPLNGRLRLGWQASDAHVRFTVRLGDTVLLSEEATIRTGEREVVLDLAPWAGQATTLVLETSLVGQTLADAPEEVVAYWVRPQLESRADWLATYDESETAAHTFDPPDTAGQVELLTAAWDKPSYVAGETAVLTLRWHAAVPTDAYPTVFIHLLDEAGEIAAQRDAPPVLGSYPVAVWQPDTIITDQHPIPLPADLPAGTYTLALGLYNPHDFGRWSAEGTADGRVLSAELRITSNE
ncbi:MAG: hypothetical protein OT477_01910 [Chloroflexi bacterium]|nr:hypothetical protein [Chloroflexota bacterium]